ncbi:frizzled-3b isoform X1 [Tachysurus ichikawai]
MGTKVDLSVLVLGFCCRGMGLLWTLLASALFACSSAILMDTVESHSMFTCEPIGLRMCQDLPYNTTFMPNLLNHYDQQTAALAMEVSECFSFVFFRVPVGLCSVWAGEGKSGVAMELVVG